MKNIKLVLVQNKLLRIKMRYAFDENGLAKGIYLHENGAVREKGKLLTEIIAGVVVNTYKIFQKKLCLPHGWD